MVSNLIDHNSQHCLVCNANLIGSSESSPSNSKNNNSDLFGKIGMAMRLKSQEVKGKLLDYIVNPYSSTDVNSDSSTSQTSDHSKQQKKTGPVFSIDDQDLGTYKMYS